MKKIIFTKQHRNLFKKLGIHTLYLFGSRAQGYSHKFSDVDIGVIFDTPKKYHNNTLNTYIKLYKIFSDLFANTPQIDIIFLQLTSPKLQFNAIRDGKVLYEADTVKRFHYEENVMKKNADLQYLYTMHHRAIRERI